MDLSKAFDCIPHDLLVTKLSAYVPNGNALKYISTYLKKSEQWNNMFVSTTFEVTSKT